MRDFDCVPRKGAGGAAGRPAPEISLGAAAAAGAQQKRAGEPAHKLLVYEIEQIDLSCAAPSLVWEID
jgi:hypothetical protein